MRRQGVITIHSPSPYENLDASTAKWLSHHKSVWSVCKNNPSTNEFLCDRFNWSRNPYKLVLSMMVSCGDFYMGRCNSFAFHIMQTFSNWARTRRSIEEIPWALRADALRLVMKQHNMDLVKLVIETYGVKEMKKFFVEDIFEFVRNEKYKEACQLASFLELHDYFGIKEFLVPLIFQDKYYIAEMFLNKSKKHQLELAVFLDDIIGKQNILHECLCIVQNLKIPDVKSTLMKYKPLSKLLTKLMKTFNLPPTTCPNMHRKKGNGILQFLLHKRYVEKTISGDSWTEMVMEALGDDENLQAALVENLTLFRDFKEALFWAEKLGVPREKWPKKLVEYSQSDRKGSVPSRVDNWDEEWEEVREPAVVNFYKFPLKYSEIKVIDTASGFGEFIVDITNGVSIVGIDAEWKPSFRLKQTDLALIQVAAQHVVYILDVIALMSAAPQPLWERFASFLLENPNVLKVGFDTRTDLQLIKDTFRKLRCLKSGSDVGFLDLAVLWHTLVCNYKFVFPFPSSPDKSANLNRLIQLCLGETLDKSDQFSNWENRPLRKNQILYAAIDAYCLLEAYNVITKEAKLQNIPISDIIEEIVHDSPANKKTRKRRRKRSIRKTELKVNECRPTSARNNFR